MTRDASHVFSFRRRLHEGESDDDNESDEERTWRLAERWKFDEDDPPAVGPEGLDEQDRVLVDDFDPKFLRHSITLLHDQDQHTLTTDNSLTVTAADGRLQTIIPYRLGPQQPMIRRDAQLGQRPMGVHPSQAGNVSIGLTMPNGTPISVQTQIKKMPHPVGIPQPQARISSNGGMRPPAAPVVASNQPPTQTSPQQMPPTQQLINGINGANANRSPSRAPDSEAVKAEALSNPMLNGTPQSQPNTNAPAVDHHISIPVRPTHRIQLSRSAKVITEPTSHHPHTKRVSRRVLKWFSCHAKQVLSKHPSIVHGTSRL
jgi:enhancer of polycomb-like protein